MLEKVRVRFRSLRPQEKFRTGKAANATSYTKLTNTREDRGATVNARRTQDHCLRYIDPDKLVWRQIK